MAIGLRFRGSNHIEQAYAMQVFWREKKLGQRYGRM